jgi:hypothetical protein
VGSEASGRVGAPAGSGRRGSISTGPATRRLVYLTYLPRLLLSRGFTAGWAVTTGPSNQRSRRESRA